MASRANTSYLEISIWNTIPKSLSQPYLQLSSENQRMLLAKFTFLALCLSSLIEKQCEVPFFE